MKVLRLFNVLMAFLLAFGGVFMVNPPGVAEADSNAQSLPFSQDWTNIGLITTSDDWSGVPGIMGYRGDGLTAVVDVDPQTVLGDDSPGVPDVNANQTAPNTFSTGGVTEFHITDPVVALTGSGTADAPYIVINLNTTGKGTINVAYNLRDIDGSVDNAVQQVALHYRVGSSGSWTNLPGGYVADATTGPSLATAVTPVSVTLPAAADNQSLVQVRVITTNATGNDEWVGIDDISITGSALADTAPSVSAKTPDNGATGVAQDANIVITFSEDVNVSDPWFDLDCTAGGNNLAAVVSGGPSVFTLDPVIDFLPDETCTVTVLAAQVEDQDSDDPPGNMTADEVWSFTTVSAGDAAPSVTAVTPLNGATGVKLDANLSVTFDEEVTLDDSLVTLVCDTSGSVTVVASAGPAASFTLDPATDLAPNETCTATIPAGAVEDTDTDDPPQNLASDYVWSFSTTKCGDTFTAIHDIQGPGLSSPLTGSTDVIVEGIVTADWQDISEMSGFFLQSAESDYDADPLTSEGIFVYGWSTVVNLGDYVRLEGDVAEYNSGVSSYGRMYAITQLTNINLVELCGTGYSITPTDVDLPVPDDTYLERYEGMLVRFTDTLTVEQNYFQGRFGQLTLGVERIFQVNNFSLGGGDTTPQTSMVILDDHSWTENPSVVPYYDLATHTPRAGDTTINVVGVLDQGKINSAKTSDADFKNAFPYIYYRLHATSAPAFTQANPRPATPPDVGGRLKIVGFNTLNYFVTLDDGSAPFPYAAYPLTPRGADTASEFTRQQAKLVRALAALDADVFGLLEIESWDDVNAPAALVNALNTYLGSTVYAYVTDPVAGYFNIETEPDSDYIQTAMIYKISTVTPVGDSLSVDDTLFDRSPFAQVFEENLTGEQFIVVANHFKSKGSCPSSSTDPNADQGDGQGCWNAKRVVQASALLDLINLTLAPIDPDVLVIGDLNAYGGEDPITELVNGGLINQLAAYVPAAQRYSYVFDGTAGYLDHALSTASLDARITGANFWHINADEGPFQDYDENYNKPGYYALDVYRSSDHDPVLVGLSLNSPPEVDPEIPDQTTPEDSYYTYTVTQFSDPNPGDTLTYAATLSDDSPLPAWLSFDPATQTFSGTPANEDVGFLNIKVSVTDTFGPDTTADIFQLEVTNTNDEPTLKNPIPDQTATEDLPFSFTFAADTFEDVDVGDTLTYSAMQDDSSPLPAWLSFDSATRTFSGTPANEDVGVYQIRVTADDGKGKTIIGDSDVFQLTVENTNDEPTVANEIPDQTATEDLPFSFTFAEDTFEDVDVGDTLTYSAMQDDGNPLPAWLSFDPLTRTFSGTPANADVGDYQIRVTADDGKGSKGFGPFDFVKGPVPVGTVDVFQLTVENVNDAPTVANLIPDQNATEDVLFSFTFAEDTFNDVDAGDSLTYSATLDDDSPLPTWLSFDPATRTFSGTPANEDVDIYQIKVTATDSFGPESVSDIFQLTVANVNDPPTLVNPIPDQTTNEDALFEFTFAEDTFEDVDSMLFYNAMQEDNTPLPAWLTFNPLTRTFSGTPTNDDVGVYQIKVVASEGVMIPTGPVQINPIKLNMVGASDVFQLTVENTNDAPTVANLIPDQMATEEAWFSFTFAADTFADVDAGDSLTYSATLEDGSALPAWLSFNALTRTFSGTPDDPDVGTIQVKVTATDTFGPAAVSDIFALTVLPVNDWPEAVDDNYAVDEDGFLSVPQVAGVLANDIDPDAADEWNAELVTPPTNGEVIFNTNGSFTYTPAPNFNGTDTFTYLMVSVSGTKGGPYDDTAMVTIQVNSINDAPTLEIPVADQAADMDNPFVLVLPVSTFDDVDIPYGDELTLSAMLADGSALPAWLSFDPVTRTFSGTPGANDVGTITIKIAAVDEDAEEVFDLFDLTVSTKIFLPVMISPLNYPY